MDWKEISQKSPRRQRDAVIRLMAHLDPGHVQWVSVPWLLGRQGGLALVAPSVPFYVTPGMASRPLSSFWEPQKDHLRPPEGDRWFLTLSTVWIAPEHRRQGHFKTLVETLRQIYSDNIAINSHVYEAVGLMGAGRDARG